MLTPLPLQQKRQHEKVRFPKLQERSKFEIEQPAIPAWLDETVEERVQSHMKHASRMKPEESKQFREVIHHLLPAYFVIDSGTYHKDCYCSSSW